MVTKVLIIDSKQVLMESKQVLIDSLVNTIITR